MTTNLGLLTSAAAKWDAMAGELKKVETRYGETVQKITMGDDTWSGVSAGVARTKFTATRYEYSAAQSQAKAVASLLRGAHEQLTDLKKKLESARDDAIAAGMTVSEVGHVAFDYSKLTAAERSAYHHDPDGQATIRTAVTKWQKHIDDRVKAVSEADTHIKDALQAAVIDSNRDALGKGADETLTGFNNYAEGDLAKAKKHEPADIKTKPDAWEVTGPGVGASASGPKYGKEASAKAYADLFHITAKGEEEYGRLKLSGIEDIYGGARATANAGISDKGIVGKAEASAGIRFLEEGRAEYGHVGGYGRVEAFGGAEAGVSAKATKEEVTVGAKAFAGGKISGGGGAEVAGIGVGLTGEGWAGPGAEASFGWRKEDGAWKISGKAGLSPGFGGAVGLEITIDPDKFGKAKDAVVDEIGSWFD
ncbi:hypothetical protein MTF65_09905 [Streptomyces sp. APSN-46.1]|uniref:hypothetical protein n=1 Tax=Streptomyces sp. APSN-46.1 TaxID=2929049 RepID=UPI001FB33A5D|nr:hypothetical protein [Streptomyces sp. APSN-46.1]MCJ1677645.1 hypothetical protein [Streptomyces sp. APSN-46.1]